MVKGQCDAYLRSMGLNKAISKIVYSTGRQNAVCANNDILYPIPKSWQTLILLDMFIEAPMHLLFLGIVKIIVEVVRNTWRIINWQQNYQSCKYKHCTIRSSMHWLSPIEATAKYYLLVQMVFGYCQSIPIHIWQVNYPHWSIHNTKEHIHVHGAKDVFLLAHFMPHHQTCANKTLHFIKLFFGLFPLILQVHTW